MSRDLIAVARRLRSASSRLNFRPPVTHVYNPLEYAWPAHRLYLTRFGNGAREVLLVGMNPGPWGMVQTGVPFGDVPMVRDWMGIEARVRPPDHLHPKRPVLGFDCGRREPSGRRLWGWAQERFGTAERFFARFFVVNYCPLAFFDKDGGNRTPDKLPVDERAQLFTVCDAALAQTIDRLQPRVVIGIGRFAEQRAAAAAGRAVRIGGVPHPSPANPQANQGWGRLMDKSLRQLGVELS